MLHRQTPATLNSHNLVQGGAYESLSIAEEEILSMKYYSARERLWSYWARKKSIQVTHKLQTKLKSKELFHHFKKNNPSMQRLNLGDTAQSIWGKISLYESSNELK